MSDFSSLNRHYAHWDCFVRSWIDSQGCHAEYLPEPWWGWQPEEGGLHSVVVNLSPGPGGICQSRRCIGCVAVDSDYTSMMHEVALRRHLNLTEKWHFTRRYRPLMLAIGAENLSGDTKHHLSIELNPFHINESDSAYTTRFKGDIVSHTLLFAAEAAALIVSPEGIGSPSPLKDIVIVRSSISDIEKKAGDCIKTEPFVIESTGIKVSVFRLSPEKYPHVADVLFVCLSGARNNLPQPQRMKEIINHINNKFKQQ